jgi:spore maturation protein CgeB
LKILYQIPSLDTIYAGRTIYHGYKNAFIDMGHKFETLTANDNVEKKFNEFAPDIFFTSLNGYFLKFLDLDVIKNHKKCGMKVCVNLPFWNSPISKFRINETASLSRNIEFVNLIKSGDFGDIYYNVCEEGDERMAGFEEATGYKNHTIPLAADKIALQPSFAEIFKADLSFIGTYSSAKKIYFSEYVFPLKKKYNLKLYGQDWTMFERALGWIQRGGQYINVPYLRSLVKPKLELEDEAKIYKSSIISINIHEDHQRNFGGDCNERTFKIPFCGGFEITDDVACIRKYFKDGEEIVIANSQKDWFDKIDYYMKYPEERVSIIEAGRKRVLSDHLYHNRVGQIIDIYETFKK